MKSKALFLILFVAISTLISAFNNPIENNSDWVLYKTVDGVSIYSKAIICSPYGENNTYLIFKYENKTNAKKEISWRLDIWFGENCRSCNLPTPNEYEFNLYLNADETKIGKCDNFDDKRFMIYKSSSKPNIQPMAKFEFSNLIVKNK